MLKRDITDELYSIVLKRYYEEREIVDLSAQMLDRIWYSLYGVLRQEGIEAAYKYAKTGKLVDQL